MARRGASSQCRAFMMATAICRAISPASNISSSPYLPTWRLPMLRLPKQTSPSQRGTMTLERIPKASRPGVSTKSPSSRSVLKYPCPVVITLPTIDPAMGTTLPAPRTSSWPVAPYTVAVCPPGSTRATLARSWGMRCCTSEDSSVKTPGRSRLEVVALMMRLKPARRSAR